MFVNILIKLFSLQEKEGKTAQQLAIARDSYLLEELLGQEHTRLELAPTVTEQGGSAQAVAAPAQVNEEMAEVKDMSVEKEKDALKRRLAELEEEERQGLESRLCF